MSNLATVWDTEIYFLDSSSLSQEILSCKSSLTDLSWTPVISGCFLTKQVEGKSRGRELPAERSFVNWRRGVDINYMDSARP